MVRGLRVLWILTRRELAEKLGSVWLYLLMSLVCLAAILFGNGFIRSFQTETVLVSTGPLAALNAGMLLFLGLVTGVRLASSLSWEREHGTLDVLLVGPATHASVVAAKFVAEVVVLCVILGFYAAFLLAVQPLGRGVLSASDAGALATWSVHVLPTMALGLLVSAAFSTVRGAVIAFLALFTVLAMIEALSIWLAPMAPTDMTLPLLFLRSTFNAAAPALEMVSAVTHLFEPVQIYLGRAVTGLAGATASLTLCLATLVLAVAVNRRRAFA